MLAISRIFASGVFFILLALGCRSNDKSNSTPASSSYGCVINGNGGIMLCTEYTNLSESDLTQIQSACQLKGYTWTTAKCPEGHQTGVCVLPAATGTTAKGEEYFYNGFSVEKTRQEMCSGQFGEYK